MFEKDPYRLWKEKPDWSGILIEYYWREGHLNKLSNGVFLDPVLNTSLELILIRLVVLDTVLNTSLELILIKLRIMQINKYLFNNISAYIFLKLL